MFLLIEVLIITVLAMILYTLIADEKKNRLKTLHMVRLKGYWNGDERRIVERLNVEMGVRYRTNGVKIDAKSMDISTKGIRLLLDEKLKKGTPLRMEIKLPDNNHLVRASGEVAWISEALEEEKGSEKRLFNTGIKFSGFQETDEKILFSFIEKLNTNG